MSSNNVENVNQNNYLLRASFVKNGLGDIGMTSGFEMEQDSVAEQDKVKAVKCLYELFEQYEMSETEREDMILHIEQMAGNNARLNTKLTELQDRYYHLEKEGWDTESRRRKVVESLAEKEKKFKQTSNRLERENKMLVSKDTHYKHALRKKEQEYRRLQESLNKITRGGVGKVTRSKLLNDSKSKSSAANATKKSSVEVSLLEGGLAACEARLSAMADENQQLKDSLKLLEQEVEMIIEPDLQRIDSSPGPNTRKNLFEVFSPTTQNALRDFTCDQIDTQPFKEIKTNLEKSVRAKLDLVRGGYQSFTEDKTDTPVQMKLFQVPVSKFDAFMPLDEENTENENPQKKQIIKNLKKPFPTPKGKDLRTPFKDITSSILSPLAQSKVITSSCLPRSLYLSYALLLF